MSNTTLMVHLELGRSNAGLLAIARDLAGHLSAGVIGIAACQPAPIGYGEGYDISGELVQAARDELERELKVAEAEFHTGLDGKIERLEWRSTVTFGVLSDYVAEEARSADLILTRQSAPDLLDRTRLVSTGSLVMQAGRPYAPESSATVCPGRRRRMSEARLRFSSLSFGTRSGNVELTIPTNLAITRGRSISILPP
jgi:hypothetical protein